MHTHEIRLRAPAFLGGGDAPVILRRTDQRFIHAVLAQLKTEQGRQRLREQLDEQAAEGDAVLYLPTQRAFHVVLAEAYCDAPGQPRVAPQRIRSAGVVLRRRMPVDQDPRTRGFRLLKKAKHRPREAVYGPPERWLTRSDRLQGWVRAHVDELLEDPVVEHRPRPRAGHAEVDRQLALRRLALEQDGRAPAGEAVHKLHLAPPDVCTAAGATLLIGVVQPVERKVAEKVDSADAEPGAAGVGPLRYSDSEVRSLLPGWLRHRGGGVPAPIPGALRGRTFRVVDADDDADVFAPQVQRAEGDDWSAFAFTAPWKPGPGADDGTKFGMQHFMRMLWQVRIELDLWSGSPESERLRQTLEGIDVRLPDGRRRALAAWLFDATELFVMMEQGIEVTFPEEWPLIPQGVHTAIVAGAKGALERQLARYTRHEHRFDSNDARYEITAFARVRDDPSCPDQLVWSRETQRYRVARWYEGGPPDAVMPTIELPTLDRGFLKNLRPNVTIKVPRSMFNFTNNLDLNKVLNGEQRNDTRGPDFGWICGFNISIIFMIAFMLLISFVFMLNIVFWWVAFFRICIPLPLPPSARESG